MILALICAAALSATLSGAESATFTPGRVIQGVVTADLWAQRAEYRGEFPTAGRVIAEVTGLPADCAVQIGSQGFSAAGSPVDWTDGEPGKTVRHVFTVESGQPGLIWVMIRSRGGSVSLGDWSAVSCSAAGPWYSLPRSGDGAAAGPAEFEGRPVRGPITFAFRAGSEAVMTAAKAPAAGPAAAGGASPGGGDFWYDAGFGCGFEVPPGWRVESPDATTRIVRPGTGGPNEIVRIEVRVAPEPGESATRRLSQVHEGRLRAGAELHAMGPLTVAGAPAMFAAHARPASPGRQYADLVVVHAGRGYWIACEGPEDAFTQAMPQYRRIIGSFSFNARPAAASMEVGG